MAKKRQAAQKHSSVKTSKDVSLSPVMQFAIVFIFVAAIVLAMVVGNKFM